MREIGGVGAVLERWEREKCKDTEVRVLKRSKERMDEIEFGTKEIRKESKT